MRISHKLLVAFICVALLVGFIGYVSLNMNQEVLNESVSGNLLALSEDNLDMIV